MKFLNQLYAWGLSILTLLLQSCNCNCTEIGCISDSKPYTLQFPSQEFTQEDLTEVHFIRVNDSYEKIDSVALDPYLNENNRKIDFMLISNLFSKDFDLNEYNYIVSIPKIHQKDSIALNYTLEITSEVCNSCSGASSCEDEYYNHWNYQNMKYTLNQKSADGSDITLSKN